MSYTRSWIGETQVAVKLGLMGITVIHSSGDNGVAGYGNVCLNISGASVGFSPSFPGTCPYVTAVGATQMNNGSTVSYIDHFHGPRYAG